MKDYEQKLYSNYYSKHTSKLYGETSIQKIVNHYPIYEYYFGKLLPSDKSISILDVGCGSGEFVNWLNSKGFVNAKGVDISNESIEAGIKLGIKNIYYDDIFNYLEKNDKKFDLLILLDVLEHFEKEDTYKLINLLNNNLNESGEIILQVPNGQSPFVGKIYFGDFTHNNAYTESSLNQLFKSIGFITVNVFEISPIPKNIKGIIRLFLWKVIRVFIKFLQIIFTGDGTGKFSPNIIALIKK